MTVFLNFQECGSHIDCLFQFVPQRYPRESLQVGLAQKVVPDEYQRNWIGKRAGKVSKYLHIEQKLGRTNC